MITYKLVTIINVWWYNRAVKILVHTLYDLVSFLRSIVAILEIRRFFLYYLHLIIRWSDFPYYQFRWSWLGTCYIFATSDIYNPFIFVLFDSPGIFQNSQCGVYCCHSSIKRQLVPQTQTLGLECVFYIYSYIRIFRALLYIAIFSIKIFALCAKHAAQSARILRRAQKLLSFLGLGEIIKKIFPMTINSLVSNSSVSQKISLTKWPSRFLKDFWVIFFRR